MTTDELRKAGLDALQRELGVVGMVRFIQLFDKGSGDYTAERYSHSKSAQDFSSIDAVVDQSSDRQLESVR